jgi:hypothetical protein
MGSDLEKAEKKRLKAQVKLEKKRNNQDERLVSKKTSSAGVSSGTQKIETKPKTVPWYKNPDWVRAIVAIVTLIIALIALYFQVLK